MCRPAQASSPIPIPRSSSRNASTRPRRCSAPPKRPSVSPARCGADSRLELRRPRPWLEASNPRRRLAQRGGFAFFPTIGRVLAIDAPAYLCQHLRNCDDRAYVQLAPFLGQVGPWNQKRAAPFDGIAFSQLPLLAQPLVDKTLVLVLGKSFDLVRLEGFYGGTSFALSRHDATDQVQLYRNVVGLQAARLAKGTRQLIPVLHRAVARKFGTLRIILGDRAALGLIDLVQQAAEVIAQIVIQTLRVHQRHEVRSVDMGVQLLGRR